MFNSPYYNIPVDLSQVNEVSINEVVQDEVCSAYTFSEIGENTIKISNYRIWLRNSSITKCD